MNVRCATGVAVVILAVGASVGCTVGEKKFACPGRPAGVHCMTTTEIYDATQNTDTVPPTADKALGDDPRVVKARSDAGAKGKARAANAGAVRATSRLSPDKGVPIVPYPMVEKPVPIRVAPRVMRVWIAPWSDSHDRLHGGEDAFVNVAEGHWVFGQSSTSVEPVRFFSLQPAASSESKGSVGKDQPAKSERAGLSERANASITRPKQESTDDSPSSQHTP